MQSALDEDRIRKYLRQMGYGVTDIDQRLAPKSGRELAIDVLRRPRNFTALTEMVLILMAFIGGGLGMPEAYKIALLTLGGLVGIIYPARAGWMALRGGLGLDMNLLITMAAIGAYIIGEYGEAATVIVGYLGVDVIDRDCSSSYKEMGMLKGAAFCP